MRDTNRLYGFYAELQKIHIEKFSDWRFGQFMNNFFSWLNSTKWINHFFPEESEMIKLLYEYADLY